MKRRSEVKTQHRPLGRSEEGLGDAVTFSVQFWFWGHEDANSDGATLSRETGEARSCPGAVQVLIWSPSAEVHGHWCACCGVVISSFLWLSSVTLKGIPSDLFKKNICGMIPGALLIF